MAGAGGGEGGEKGGMKGRSFEDRQEVENGEGELKEHLDQKGDHDEQKSEKEESLSPTKSWMASRSVSINSLPVGLLQSAKSLFSAFPSTSVRNWGYHVVQSYVQLSGVEKPSDIRKVQPFATSLKTVDEDIRAPQTRGFYKLPNESLSDSYSSLVKEKGLNEVEKRQPYQKEHAVGYAYKKMPNSYSSIFRILHEVKHRMPSLSPSSCLDYGAGTGAGLWAANEIWPEMQITAVEPSKEMRTVGKKLSVKLPNVKWAESLANLPSIANKEGLFDVVICGYVLSEIENPVTRNLILDALWQRTGKIMVFVEPGTPKGSRLIYNIRQWTLTTMNRDQANIVAPCPHDGECPLAASPRSWCHFSQFTAKYPKDVITRVKGESNFENEKFSYIVICRGVSPRHLDASLQLNLAQQSFLWSRLVRPVIRRTRHMVFDVCRIDKLERIILTKGKANKEVYRFLRNARWGDLWPFNESEYIDEEKRKEKLKKYRVRRKLRKLKRKLAEKGESEGTDLEEEKKKIKERQEKHFDESGKKRNNHSVKKKIRDLGNLTAIDRPSIKIINRNKDSEISKFKQLKDSPSEKSKDVKSEISKDKRNRTGDLKAEITEKEEKNNSNSESPDKNTPKVQAGRRSSKKGPKPK
jgi:ribosomal protein RSM22 (predicted rRNA methylase)